MPIFCKVHMTMCSYSDAGKLNEKDNELTAKEKHNASYLIELPSFSEWFHYMQLGSTTWSGPMVEYSDYLDFIDMGPKSDIAKMPDFGNWWPAWKRFIEVWLCAGIYVLIGEFIDPKYLSSTAFLSEPLYYKVFHLCMSMQI